MDALGRVCRDADCSPDQATHAVTSALRLLHKAAVTDPKGATASLLECVIAFGPEATFHLGGILEVAKLRSDPALPWSETMARLVPRSKVYSVLINKWRKKAEDR